MSLVVSLQSLLLGGVGAWGLLQLLVGNTESFATAITLAAILVAAVVWSVNIAIGLRRLKPWSRTAAVVVQMIFISVGVASYGGSFGNFWIGTILLAPASLALFLLFGRSVGELFRRD